jgi:hypothetical protein
MFDNNTPSQFVPNPSTAEPNDHACANAEPVGTWHASVGTIIDVPALPTWMTQRDRE